MALGLPIEGWVMPPMGGAPEETGGGKPGWCIGGILGHRWWAWRSTSRWRPSEIPWAMYERLLLVDLCMVLAAKEKNRVLDI